MKKKFRILICSTCLGVIAVLSQVAALAQTNAPAQATTSTSSSEDEPRFQKGEKNVSPFGAYVDQAGGKWAAGVAITYFITDKIGIGGSTYWTDTGGTFFDNAAAEGYFRLPVFKRLAPYAVASIGYQFDRQYWFETIGAGLDFRAFKRFDAFSDLQYRISNSSSKSGDGAIIRVGMRFNF
jgi:hypothetical protein